MTLANLIKEKRKKKKWTTTKLSKKLGVSTGIVSLWENKKREPNWKSLVKLMSVLKIKRSDLVELVENEIKEK